MRRTIFELEAPAAALRVTRARGTSRVEVAVEVAGLELGAKLSIEQALALGRALEEHVDDVRRRLAGRDPLRAVPDIVRS